MHFLTVELIRFLIGNNLRHAVEIDAKTASSIVYCLNKMEKYASKDWALIGDLAAFREAIRRQLADNQNLGMESR